jgi:hypothetical protein
MVPGLRLRTYAMAMSGPGPKAALPAPMKHPIDGNAERSGAEPATNSLWL